MMRSMFMFAGAALVFVVGCTVEERLGRQHHDDGGEGGEPAETTGGSDGNGGSGVFVTGGMSGTNGSGSSGGTSASGSSGTAALGGSTAGSGGANVTPIIPGLGCDWVTALKSNCAISSCHGKLFQYGRLLLTPDIEDSMGRDLIERLKDVPASFADIDCDPSPTYEACVSPPPECQQFVGDKLVDSANPDRSFILTKMSPSGCGNVEPISPGDSPTTGWGEERRACIEDFVRGIAALPVTE